VAARSELGVAPRAPSALRDGWDDLVRLFANVGFGVSLLALWALLTLIGVIVDQGKDPAFYVGAYGPPFARLIAAARSRQHLSQRRLHRHPRADPVLDGGRDVHARDSAPHPALGPVKIDAIPLHAAVHVRRRPADVRARIAAFFAARGWHVRKREFGGDEWTFADKNNWARRGVLVAHVGFVIIALGTTIYWAKGFSGQFAVLSGTSATIPQTGATVA
jgi:cytochrome c biogenesis protein ResB